MDNDIELLFSCDIGQSITNKRVLFFKSKAALNLTSPKNVINTTQRWINNGDFSATLIKLIEKI